MHGKRASNAAEVIARRSLSPVFEGSKALCQLFILEAQGHTQGYSHYYLYNMKTHLNDSDTVNYIYTIRIGLPGTRKQYYTLRITNDFNDAVRVHTSEKLNYITNLLKTRYPHAKRASK